jgi:ferredoxin
MSVRIIVDYQVCEANGLCAGIAPGVFRLDDEDNLHVAVEYPASGDVPLVRQAVRCCPKMALTLDEGDPCE